MDNESTRRQSERLPGVFQVRFSDNGTRGEGVVVDLTSSGMRLRTNYPVTEDSSIHLSLVGPDYETIEVDGTVRWVSELSPVPVQPQSFSFEAGIRVNDPPPELSRLFDSASDRFIDFRDWPRFPHQMRLELAGPGIWETTFALNLSRRGLFVLTRQEFQTGQLVQMRTTLDGRGESIQLSGEVVYLLTQHMAEEVGGAPGIGVRLSNVTPSVKEQYTSFIEVLENRYQT